MQQKNQIQTLQQYINEIVPLLKTRSPKNSGALNNSISGELDNAGDTLGLSISMLSYGDFVNKGVNGVKNSVGSIYSFKDKMPPISGLKGYGNPYAVAKSIYNKGIKPTLFIDNTATDQSIDELANNLAEATWQDFYEQTNETNQ
jgi:hypothetical protein